MGADRGPGRAVFRQAVELGVTFWDTANVYQRGTSEEIVGRAITRYSRREDIVLATKVRGKMHDGPGGSGLSRKAILEQIDASLTRLGTDYIDLYQIHRFDDDTPVEETMEALHDIIKAGKVRYIGASSMYAWQFAKLQHAADLGGWTRFVSMQNQYNLLRRHDERELMAMCGDMGVGLVPYSPNGKGRLARPAGEQSTRSSTDKVVQAFDSPARRARHQRRREPCPRHAVSAWPRSPWPGCCATRWCRRPSSERPNLTTSPKPSPRSTSTSPTRKPPRSKGRTSSTAPPGIDTVHDVPAHPASRWSID